MTESNKTSEAVTDKKQTQVSNSKISQDSISLEVKPTLILADGRHEGIILKLEYITDPYGYINISIKEKKTEQILKLDFPDTITERTGLGKFLAKMGVKLSVGNIVDLNKELLGRTVSFMSDNEETDKGVFVRIIPGSVKPKS